jgi:hypothetical protein
VRGVVSLAAALAIPLTTLAGGPFPYPDLILFVTFGVIVVTLGWPGIAVAGTCALERQQDASYDRPDRPSRYASESPEVKKFGTPCGASFEPLVISR